MIACAQLHLAHGSLIDWDIKEEAWTLATELAAKKKDQLKNAIRWHLQYLHTQYTLLT